MSAKGFQMPFTYLYCRAVEDKVSWVSGEGELQTPIDLHQFLNERGKENWELQSVNTIAVATEGLKSIFTDSEYMTEIYLKRRET
jgi:hypothetical protein